MDTLTPEQQQLKLLHTAKLDAYDAYHAAEGSKRKTKTLREYLKRQSEYEELRVQLAVRSKIHQHHNPNAEIVNLEKEDIVNNPRHYTQDGEIECIEAIRAALGSDGFRAFCRGNAMKYVWRCDHKKSDDPTTDLRKASWYMIRAAEEAGG